MSRKARTHSSLALALVVFIVAGLWFASRQLARAGETPLKGGDKLAESSLDASSAKAKAAKLVVFPLPTDFKVKLLRAGLTPRALAAAGVLSNSILPTLQAAADQMNGAPGAMETADAAYVSARVAADALASKIQGGTASQEEVAGYPPAKSALDAASAARQAVLDGYFSAATANLTANQRSALTTIRANKALGFPEEYLVVNKTEAEWLALRNALSTERQAIDLPDMGSEAATQLLTTFRADPSVAFATTGVQTGLAPITTAWNTAAGD